MNQTVSRRTDLTFKHNLALGRHGWLRLTPAYSVKLVQETLKSLRGLDVVLDPFSGTGTTGLVCAEHGIACDLVELNPFLVWLAKVKTRTYTTAELDVASRLAQAAATEARRNAERENAWIPPLNAIERWWSPEKLAVLASLFQGLRKRRDESGNRHPLNLCLVAFCRTAIDWSNAAFNHQSMSFKEEQPSLFVQAERDLVLDYFLSQTHQVLNSAKKPISGKLTVYRGDSRNISDVVKGSCYDCVITSPPYPNRISYIREVRPYMYWLGYLKEAREAGDLDWEAIGGTWGVATSRLAAWVPNGVTIRHEGFEDIILRIAKRSLLLSNYVHKYFEDMATHLANLRRVLTPNAKLFYIVGNSKFYDTVVPVEQIYCSLMRQFGFRQTESLLLRKRSSKKELYEFVVSAEWRG